MTIILISKIVFIISILGILVIIIRKLPVLSGISEDYPVSHVSFKEVLLWPKNTFKKLISSHFFQDSVIGNLEKLLRRTRIFFLKIGNRLDRAIERLQKKD